MSGDSCETKRLLRVRMRYVTHQKLVASDDFHGTRMPRKSRHHLIGTRIASGVSQG